MSSAPVTIELPYPLSANRYWRSFVPRGWDRAVVAVSDEAKVYKGEVRWLCRQAGITKPLQGRLHVDLKLYPARPQDASKRARANPTRWDDDVRCIDLDNARKVVLDALKGIVFDDDKWIWRDSGERMEPDGAARVVVTITPIEVESPQPELAAVCREVDCS